MLLRNFDFAVKYLDYDSGTEHLITEVVPIYGWYKCTENNISGLMVNKNNLYFFYRKECFLISDSHCIIIECISDLEYVFRLVYINKILIEYLYLKNNLMVSVSPFEYIDEDDSQWEQFVEKIINDSNRKMNFIMNLMEGK